MPLTMLYALILRLALQFKANGNIQQALKNNLLTMTISMDHGGYS